MGDSNLAKDVKQGATQQKVQRLNSLLFGVDLAFSKGDTQTALGLGLRLLGFLESECQTAEDVVYVEPIKRQVVQKLNAATLIDRSVTICNRRQALDQAGAPADFKFKHHRPVDIEKIKTSKYYSGPIQRAQLANLTVSAANHHGVCESKVEANLVKSGRSLMQSKITSLYGNGNQKPEPAQKGKNSLPSRYASGPYRPPQMEQKEPISLSSPEAGEKHNPYGYNRKRPRNPYYGTDKWSENPKPAPKEDTSSDDDAQETLPTSFVTARHKLIIDELKKNGVSSNSYQGNLSSSAPPRTGLVKSLGMPRRGVRGSFVPPVRGANGSSVVGAVGTPRTQGGADNCQEDSTRKCMELLAGPDGQLPDRLRNLEPKLLEHVSNEIMDQDPAVHWDDIAGLEHAKKCVTEMVIWPLLRPDIFQGCRAPGKGLLLFGPPGTGKTMIGKAIAGEAKATFFSISASSLTSKWIGEGEKLVRALFGVASCRQPAVIFVDEIDSLLSQRKAEGEHESSRRIKTQFLIEMEGCGSGSEQILLIGATNRPQELDEAARRRLSKRLYIPLPSAAARAWIVRNLLGKDGLLSLTDAEIESICTTTDGYSGSDMKNLVKEASMGPLREALMQGRDIGNISKDEMRPISVQDFMNALQQVRPSVSESELGLYQDWNRQFGSLAI
ncbi:unnamed protein product [Sphagnum jensenii]|uniref:AAA+ ATPase domain-containing protein n=1 Tax=Sphagnum jensenii TaxID=128206 RepID=A0ABP0WBM8_9BRYO